MAIRDDSKYVEDNMDYKSKKDEMQKNNNMKMAGGVFNISDYNKYKKAVEDDNVIEVFPDTSIFELEKMRELYEKEKARKLQG
jgi:ASC-1-like (ASCH) protein